MVVTATTADFMHAYTAVNNSGLNNHMHMLLKFLPNTRLLEYPF